MKLSPRLSLFLALIMLCMSFKSAICDAPYITFDNTITEHIMDCVTTFKIDTTKNPSLNLLMTVLQTKPNAISLDVLLVGLQELFLEISKTTFELTQEIADKLEHLIDIYEGLTNPRAPREDSDLIITEQTTLGCTIPKDFTVEHNLTVKNNATILGTLFTTGGISFNSSIILQPTTGNGICTIFKEDDGFEKGRICSSATENEKGLFISIDSGTTRNFGVDTTGDIYTNDDLYVSGTLEVAGMLVLSMVFMAQ